MIAQRARWQADDVLPLVGTHAKALAADLGSAVPESASNRSARGVHVQLQMDMHQKMHIKLQLHEQPQLQLHAQLQLPMQIQPHMQSDENKNRAHSLALHYEHWQQRIFIVCFAYW